MKKTKKIATMIVIMLLIFTLSSGIYAYYTYFKSSKENTVVLGYNKIVINENYVPPLKMEKGVSFTKEPFVTNAGDVDCYIRIKSEISDSRVAEDLIINYNSSEDFNDDSKDWYYKDGYYYYKKALKPNENTKSIFTTVQILDTADDLVLEGFDIYIYAESIQTVKNKGIMETWSYFNN